MNSMDIVYIFIFEDSASYDTYVIVCFTRYSSKFMGDANELNGHCLHFYFLKIQPHMIHM